MYGSYNICWLSVKNTKLDAPACYKTASCKFFTVHKVQTQCCSEEFDPAWWLCRERKPTNLQKPLCLFTRAQNYWEFQLESTDSLSFSGYSENDLRQLHPAFRHVYF